LANWLAVLFSSHGLLDPLVGRPGRLPQPTLAIHHGHDVKSALIAIVYNRATGYYLTQESPAYPSNAENDNRNPFHIFSNWLDSNK
jgi:hypothetical protein